jgi:hypothetical protein
MKLTLTMNGFTYSAESEGDDHNVEEMVYQMRGLLVSAGYHPNSVDQYFQEGEYVWDLDTKYDRLGCDYPQQEEFDPRQKDESISK